MATTNSMSAPLVPPVQLTKLNFAFAKVTVGGQLINHLQHETPSRKNAHQDDDYVLKDVTLTIGNGQRVLVVGGNGAGKSTLLGVLAGKHLTADDTALVFGRDSFRDTTLNLQRTFVSADWGQRAVAFATHAMAYSADMAVDEMMVQLQAAYPERRAELLHVLRIDPKWRLHRLSDGQRRRVQLFLALLRPSKLIILDEVLGMLDLISRTNVLAFLKKETESERKATVLLATHIFDGTDTWATHALYVKRGTVGFYGQVEECTRGHDGETVPMYTVVERWLRQELDEDGYIEGEASGGSGEFDLSNAQNRAGGKMVEVDLSANEFVDKDTRIPIYIFFGPSKDPNGVGEEIRFRYVLHRDRAVDAADTTHNGCLAGSFTRKVQFAFGCGAAAATIDDSQSSDVHG